MNPKLVVCLFCCAAAGVGAAAATLIAGRSLLVALAVCSLTASLCLLPATLLASRRSGAR